MGVLLQNNRTDQCNFGSGVKEHQADHANDLKFANVDIWESPELKDRRQKGRKVTLVEPEDLITVR